MSLKKIRVRFAPSPTGNLHIGATRTALFNFLYAQKMKGEFVLRIEDTDKERSKEEYEDDIMRSLEWIGVKWDLGPFRQSERSDVYKKYLNKLIESGKVYPCFCTKEKLEENRKKQQERKEPPRYEGDCASLSEEERKKMIEDGMDFVFRIKVPQGKIVEIQDKIKGKIEFNTSDIGGDFVVAKKDLSPLYNFACVVDDYDMGVTDVIRGDDHISNTPKQIIISEALNIPIPSFAHLPLILGPDKNKLSKRHGAVSLYEYKEQGYLPEALFNFISLLGWNPGTEEEIYSPEKIIEMFLLEKCQKSPAVFDIEKLKYINGRYIRSRKIEQLTKDCIPFLVKENILKELSSNNYQAVETKKEVSFKEIEQIIGLYQERLKYLSEVGELVDYFFKEELEYEKELLFWKNAEEEEIKKSIDKSIKILLNIKEWEKEKIEEILIGEANRMKNRGLLLWPLRVAVSGKKASASPFDIVYLLGKEEALNRLKKALKKL
ncbi:MAG: glutamate--tRNA ligase [Patescibacteria group bacterium]|nr:glutamate--tRNA ligase [Patescibacteria group bacterium]